MFAVPGWTLGPLKTEEAQDAGSKEKRSSKKRKRNHEARDAHSTGTSGGGRGGTGPINGGSKKVTGENVAEMWTQHVENNRSSIKQSMSDKSATTKAQAATETQGGDPAATNNTKSRQNHSKNKNPKEYAKHSGKAEAAAIPPSTDSPTALLQRQQHDPTPDSASRDKLTPMQAAMRQKLVSARFRHLNQTLYTAPSSEAKQLFETNPSFFEEYHAGFRQQVSSWPENPVDSFLRELKKRGAVRSQHGKHSKAKPSHQPQQQQPLPRSSGTCIVADLGCGDARLAKELQPSCNKLAIKLLSYDLQKDSPLVTKADISQLPLETGSVNVAILCLALMGTNWIDFVEEAWRILHWKGELWVAEIKSRFARAKDRQPVDHSIGKRRKVLDKYSRRKDKEAQQEEEEQLRVEVDGSTSSKGQTDVSAFVAVLERRGFALRGGHDGIDLSNKMFVRLHFVKSKTPTSGKHATERSAHAGHQSGDGEAGGLDETTALKPCLYKIR